MPSNNLTDNRKDDLLFAIGKLGYTISEISTNPSIVHIKGKVKTIRCNLHCTQSIKKVNGIECYWFGFRTSVLDKVDFITLVPTNFSGFYNIPKSTFLNNMHVFFATRKNSNDFTFSLMAGEEIIFGYSKENSINVGDDFGVVIQEEMKVYDLNSPLLPHFPIL